MNFVIIASRRTGSSHFINTLGGHPDIFCHGNVFDERMMAVFWPKGEHPKPLVAKKAKQEWRELRSRDSRAFLEFIFATRYGRSNCGFKIFQGENDNILDTMLAESSVKKIILYRKNVLAVYSSALAARQTGKWGVIKGNEPPPPTKVVFNDKEFNGFYTRYTRFYVRTIQKLNRHHQTFSFLNYEDINDPHVLSSVITFVGADPNRSIAEDTQRKQQVKLNSSNILERFSNTSDVEDFMQKNGLQHWHHEGEAPIGQL